MTELLTSKPSQPMRFMYHSLRERVKQAQGAAPSSAVGWRQLIGAAMRRFHASTPRAHTRPAFHRLSTKGKAEAAAERAAHPSARVSPLVAADARQRRPQCGAAVEGAAPAAARGRPEYVGCDGLTGAAAAGARPLLLHARRPASRLNPLLSTADISDDLSLGASVREKEQEQASLSQAQAPSQ